MKHAAVEFNNPNLLFKYTSAFYYKTSSQHLIVWKTALLTLPFMVDIRCLPMAMTRLVNSTMIGFVFGALATEINAWRASPMPAANVFVD